MSWFQKICRNAGLMVHGIKQPIKEDKQKQGSSKQVVRHDVEEEQIDENVTLRRTTIEEIETRKGVNPDKLKSVAEKPAPQQNDDKPNQDENTPQS